MNMEKGKHFHAAVLAIYFSIFAVSAMTFSHPIYTSAMLFVCLFGATVFGGYRKLLSCLIFGLYMTLFLIAVNTAVSQEGATPIFEAALPFSIKITVYKEPILYGLNMGMKLTLIMCLFAYLGSAMDFDDSVSMLSRLAPKSSLVASLTSLTMPRLMRNLSSIKEAMTVKGVDFSSGNPIKRLKSRYPLYKTLLLSAVEGSMETSEALYARAYAIKKRVNYPRDKFSRFDYAVMAFLTMPLSVCIISAFYSRGFHNFYTDGSLSVDGADSALIMILSAGFLALPSLKAVAWK